MNLLGGVVRNLSQTSHLLQMLASMVGMDHLVGNSHIVSSENLNGLSTRMVETIQIVDDSINADLVVLEGGHRADDFGSGLSGGSINIVGLDGVCLPLADLVSVWGHGYKIFVRVNAENLTKIKTAIQPW